MKAKITQKIIKTKTKTDTDKKKGYGGRFSSSPISTSGSIEVGRKQFKKIIKAATTTNHSPELAKWL